MMTDNEMIKRITIRSVLAVSVLITAWSSYYTVSEGHVGIVTRFSKAIAAVDPGPHVKIPFIDGVVHFDVRQRRNIENMSAATENQLPITAEVSINWTIHKGAAFDIFVNYGGLQQFETRILDPKFRQATKAALSRYRADQLIRERDLAAADIQAAMADLMESFPVEVNSPQIENIVLPEQYLTAVMSKEQARENAAKEQHVLNQQKLIAQQAVQTAEAERDAQIARADGKAYQTRTEAAADADAQLLRATAEAAGLEKIAGALAENPKLIEYEQVKKWAGQVPTTVLGGDQSIFYTLKQP